MIIVSDKIQKINMKKFSLRLFITSGFLLFMLLGTFSLLSQSTADTLRVFPFKFGTFFDYELLFHTANFKKLPGIPNCCPRFEEGNGNGFSIGVLGEYSFLPRLSIGTYFFYRNFGGNLSKIEPTALIYQGKPLEGEFEHQIKSKFTDVGVKPYISFNPVFDLYLSINFEFGYSLTTWFEQAEKIVKPKGIGTFLDSNGNDTRSRIRNQFFGKIPEATSFHQSIAATIYYELPLNKHSTYRLVPKIGFSYGLNELVLESSWKIKSLFAGLSIKYQPIPKPQPTKLFRKEYRVDTLKIFVKDIPFDTIFKLGTENLFTQTLENNTEILEVESYRRTDTMFIKKAPLLTGTLSLVGIDSLGAEITDPEILVEEFVFNRLDPLLNYVFFDENSSEIPGRYKLLSSEQTKQFTIDNLFYDSTIEIYYNLLNIVAKRLMTYKDATIRLVGCNSNTGVEKGNLVLSRKRAESIRNYLVTNWNIDSTRIKIEVNNLPSKPSTPIDEPAKMEENQRVEIYSDTYEILEPVFVRRVENKVSPEQLKFRLNWTSESGVKKITLVASQTGADTLIEKEYESDFPNSIFWDINQTQERIPKHAIPINFKVEILGLDGNQVTLFGKTKPLKVITVEKKRAELIGDFELEQFGLILFDFDKATIEDNHLRIIDFIKSRLKPESQIEIEGFTDRIGDAEYNRLLSERRAIATKNVLKRFDSKTIGFGESKLLFNNDLPEGRFYCRTIIVKVKTPVKGDK